MWGGVVGSGTDLQGDRFDPSVETESSYTKTGRLLVDWEHGRDDDPDSPGCDKGEGPDAPETYFWVLSEM